MELSLSFSEAAKGCTKHLSFDATVPCDSCGELSSILFCSRMAFGNIFHDGIASTNYFVRALIAVAHAYSFPLVKVLSIMLPEN